MMLACAVNDWTLAWFSADSHTGVGVRWTVSGVGVVDLSETGRPSHLQSVGLDVPVKKA